MFDPKLSAEEAGLRYVTDQSPGIRRKKRGKGFSFHDDAHGKVTCEKVLARIKSLVIPPAWEDVWICRLTNGHLQVTGRDARERKQYRYHEKWNVERNTVKFDRMKEFGEVLPSLRARVEEDLKLPGLPKNKILACVIKVMLITQSRVGNSLYAEENESYGLTTILNEHAKVRGSKIKLSFRGKSGVDHDINIVDPVLSKIISRCQHLPGEELFGYLDDDGNAVDITSSNVNDYLREVTGKDFTAKDLRLWGGTVKAIECVIESGLFESDKETHWKKRHLEFIRSTATHLKNTVAVCRKYYIHPAVFENDRSGKIHKLWKNARACTNFTRPESLLIKLL